MQSFAEAKISPLFGITCLSGQAQQIHQNLELKLFMDTKKHLNVKKNDSAAKQMVSNGSAGRRAD